MPATVLPFDPSRRCSTAQHGPAPTSSVVQHGRTEPLGYEVHVEPLIDTVARRLGPNGYIVVSGDGRRVLDCSDPHGAA
jgi:hypothetical protein